MPLTRFAALKTPEGRSSGRGVVRAREADTPSGAARRYLDLAAIDLAGRAEPALAIGDPRGRDHAARDFKRHLKLDLGWKPASVNLALAAVDHF